MEFYIKEIRRLVALRDRANIAWTTCYGEHAAMCSALVVLADQCAINVARNLCKADWALYRSSEMVEPTTLLELWNANDGDPAASPCGPEFYAALADLAPGESVNFGVVFTRLGDADRQASIAEKWGPGGSKSADGGPL